MFCPACGDRIPDGSRFCPACGSRIVTIAPEPAGTMSGGRTLAGDAPLRLETGSVLHDRYEIRDLLGQGGMGVVYRARDRLTGEEVCVKTIRPGPAGSAALTGRFLREGSLTRRLRHGNIVAVYDVNVAGDLLYMVMEFLPGEVLRRWLTANLVARREVPFETARRILAAILAGLGSAHSAGIVHRDLKPENVMLLSDPMEGEVRLKLLDFGIARALEPADRFTRTGAVMGTPIYMAPEQETGADTAGPEADLYSAGVILYEIVTGVPPRGRWEYPSRLRDDVPPELDAFLEKALQPHPARRFARAAEMEAKLLALPRSRASAPPPPPPRAPEPEPPRPAPAPPPRPVPAPRAAETVDGMTLVRPGDGPPFWISKDVVEVEFGPATEEDYAVPPAAAGHDPISWMLAEGAPPDRRAARKLLAVFGRRLPSRREIDQAVRAGAIEPPGIPVWLREEPHRLHLPDGSVGFPELLDRPGRQPRLRGLLAVRDAKDRK